MTESTSTAPNAVEQWAAVPGWEGVYAVSNLGRLRRERDGARGDKTAGLILSMPRPTAKGYQRACLSLGPHTKWYMLHRLVAAAFLGPPPDGHEINHINGNKLDNRVSNIEYLTHRQNVRHAFDTNLAAGRKGASNPAAKLTEASVGQIRKQLRGGASLGQLAKAFGVSKPVIACIRDRATWKHVE